MMMQGIVYKSIGLMILSVSCSVVAAATTTTVHDTVAMVNQRIERAQELIKELRRKVKLLEDSAPDPVSQVYNLKRLKRLTQSEAATFNKQLKLYKRKGVPETDERVKYARDRYMEASLESRDLDNRLFVTKQPTQSLIEMKKKRLHALIEKNQAFIDSHTDNEYHDFGTAPQEQSIKPEDGTVEKQETIDHGVMPMQMGMGHRGHGDQSYKQEQRITLSGFIRHDTLIDSRQVEGMREDVVLMFSAPRKRAENDCDTNARSQLTMASILTRVGMNIVGPRVWQAQSSAFIEGDFFGPWVIDNTTDTQISHVSTINSFTLRHAYMFLQWEHVSLLAGQYWHPFADHHAHHQVAFMAHLFEPMSFNPQFRVTIRASKFELIAAALSQIHSRNYGFEEFSTKYLRNATAPNWHAHIKAYWGSHLFGLGIDHKKIVPRLENIKVEGRFRQERLYKVNEKLRSTSVMGYAMLDFSQVFGRFNVTYAENLPDHMMLGGFVATCRNNLTGQQEYTPLRSYALLTEWNIKGDIEPGVSIGYTKNIGTRTPILNETEGRARLFGVGVPHHGNQWSRSDVASILRIAPRLFWYVRPLVVGAELSYLRTVYGNGTDSHARPIITGVDTAGRANKDVIQHARLYMSMVYLF